MTQAGAAASQFLVEADRAVEARELMAPLLNPETVAEEEAEV